MTGKCKSFLAGPFLISGVRACLFYTADDFIDVGYFVLDEVGLNALKNIPGCIGVDKVGGSYSYCGRSGHEEFKGVFGSGDALSLAPMRMVRWPLPILRSMPW